MEKTWTPGDEGLEPVRITLDFATLKFAEFERRSYFKFTEFERMGFSTDNFDDNSVIFYRQEKPEWKKHGLYRDRDVLAIEGSLPKEKVDLIQKHFDTEMKGQACRFPAFLEILRRTDLELSQVDPYIRLINVSTLEENVPNFMDTLVKKVEKLEKAEKNEKKIGV